MACPRVFSYNDTRVNDMQRILIPILAAVALAACATAPKPLQGEYATSHPQDSGGDGARIRWGGEIISVEPKPEVTCFQILARDLSQTARPRSSDSSRGRFLACRKGFYDPAVFTTGRDVTVVGVVAGSEVRRIGEYDYPLPRVDANAVYLWPERPLYERRYYAPSPFWYPGIWGWGGFYGVHHRHWH